MQIEITKFGYIYIYKIWYIYIYKIWYIYISKTLFLYRLAHFTQVIFRTYQIIFKL